MKKAGLSGRRIAAAGFLVAVGVLGGAAYPGPVAPQAESCQMRLCTNDVTCIPTLNWWYCDSFGGGCITRECGTGRMMCPPLGHCPE